MKSIKLLIGLFCFIFLTLSFVLYKKDSRDQYQTFDEYELKGVPFMHENRDLYVLVDKQKDTIKVQISNDISNLILYVNKQKYWYSLTTKELEVTESVFAVEYNEKYIYNDTILNYNYQIHTYKDTIESNSDYIYIETKDRILYLFYDREITKMIRKKDDVEYRFKTIKMLLDNYKDIFIPAKYPIIVPPVREYYSYRKEFKNDTLFLYSEKNGDCLSKARLLNSLGEFDIAKGRDVLGDVISDKKCK